MSSRSFSIKGKGIKFDTKADIEPYLKQILDIPGGVEEIHFGGNTLGVEPCVALAETLKQVDTLKVADFADIFTGRLISEIPLALQALCDALVDKPSLVELDLSDNAFGGRSAEPMVNFLTNNRTFSILRLQNNGLGIWGGTTVANALLESAKLSEKEGKKSNLRVVVCGRNRLENGSAPFFAEAFAAHKTLREVVMPQNGINKEGIQVLATGLANCPDLEVLDLQDNTATESGTRAVALALPKWKNLLTLNLSDCLLSAKGGIALATALNNGATPKLETLRLQYGEFDKRAINLLASAISTHMPSLSRLEINGNKADPEDECIQNVKDALEKNGFPEALDELDDMEDADEDDEEESAAVEEAEEIDKKEAEAEDTPAPAPSLTAPATLDPTDELASLMGKVNISTA
ncbi:putative ran GTPase activating protein 1 [Clavulina sp. PMI_390]|nr:putative ran GTPase activating protein 1 [Clavulina sp. PMI_390]